MPADGRLPPVPREIVWWLSISPQQVAAMNTGLTAIKAALAEIGDTELHAMIAATNGVTPAAYDLLVWIEGTCDWR